MTELRSERFEWFGPSPIEPFNPGPKTSVAPSRQTAASSVFHPNLEEYEEAMDDGVQGVGKAALGSLQESGFAAKRAVSPLVESFDTELLSDFSAK